jgi:hypothetical protein
MELDTLILADAASTPFDGKFYIHGGGLTRYEIAGLPAQIPLGVLIRFRVSEKDAHLDHRLYVALIGPAGVPNVAPVEIQAMPPDDAPDLLEGEEQFFQIGFRIPAIAIREGLYQLELRHNDQLVRKVPLPVVVTPGGIDRSPPNRNDEN